MADLGNLNFGVHLKNLTDADFDKIKNDLLKKKLTVSAKVGLSVDPKTASNAIEAVLKAKTYDVKVKPTIDNTNKPKIDLDVDQTQLVANIKSTLKNNRFDAKVSLVVDKAKVQDAIKRAFARAGLNYNTTASDVRQNLIDTRSQAAADKHAIALERLNRLQQRAVNGQRNLTQEIARTNSEWGKSQNYLERMAIRMGVVYGLYQLQNFARGLYEIGGEFQKQQIALKGIIGEEGKALKLYEQIKTFSVQSPFQFGDLATQTKQLAAYGVQYSELFETTKRLGDISAGVGVDMGRLILAYGQIKAKQSLAGTELRQLTETGIPMVEELAKRFSELEGRVVSVGEVYDRVSKKQVSFGDVKSVLFGMTEEGGQFYDMQKNLSDSLAGKWSNMADAWDVMMSDIANSTNNELSGALEMVTKLMNNWQVFGAILGSIAGVYGLYRGAMLINNTLLGTENAELIKSTIAAKQKEAINLKLASSYRTLSAAEQGKIITSGKMTTTEWRNLIVNKELTKEQALRLMALGKIKRAQAGHLIQLLGITKAEMNAAYASSTLRVRLAGLAASLETVGLAMKSLLFNPFTILFAAVSAAMSAYASYEAKMDDMEERIKNMGTRANEGFRSLKEFAEGFKGIDLSLEGGEILSSEATERLAQTIKDMKEQLKDYSPLWAQTFNNAFAVDEEGKSVNSLAKQYKILRDAILETKDAYEVLNLIKGFSEKSNDYTDGILDESLKENMEDFAEAERAVSDAVDKMSKNYIKYSAAMESVIEKNEAFAKVASGKTLAQQIKLLRDFPDAAYAFAKSTKVPYDFSELRVAWYKSNLVKSDELMPDLEDFIKDYKNKLKANGFDLSNLTEPQKVAIGLDIGGLLDAVEGLTPELRKLFNKEILEKHFNIKVDVEYQEAEDTITELQKKFNDATNDSYKVEVLASTNAEEIIEGIRKAYKDAKSIIKENGDLLIKIGVNLDNVDNLDESKFAEWQQDVLKRYKEFKKKMDDAEKGAKELGFSLDEKTDKSKRTGGSSKDPVAEKWKERTSLIERAVSLYEKWAKIEGVDTANKRVMSDSTYSKALNSEGISVDLESPEEAYKQIQQLLDVSKEKQKELYVSLGVKVSDREYKDAKENIDEVLKRIKKDIDDHTKKWNIYENIFKSTGNRSLADNLAFGKILLPENGLLKDLRNEIERGLEGNQLSFSDVIKMDSEGLEAEGLSTIKDFVDAYNKGMDSLRESTVTRLAEMLNDNKAYGDKLIALQEELNKDLSDIELNRTAYESSGIDVDRLKKERKKQYDTDSSELQFEEFKKTSDWVKVFDDLDNVSSSTLDHMAKELENYAQKGDLSVEVTKEIAKALRKIKEESIERNPFKGIIDSISKIEKFDFAKKKLGKNDSYTFEKDEKGFKKGQTVKKNDVDDGFREANKSFSNAIDGIIGNLDAFASGLNMVEDMLGSLGLSDTPVGQAAGVVSGAAAGASGMMGVASMLGDAAGPWGAALGAAMGLVSGIAKMHDEALQKSIERSKARVKELESAYDSLEKSIERSLGSGLDISNTLKDFEQLEAQIKRAGSSISYSFRLQYEALKDGGKSYFEEIKSRIEAMQAENESIDNILSNTDGFRGAIGHIGQKKENEYKIEIDTEKLQALLEKGIGTNNLDNSILKQYEAQYVGLVEQRSEIEGQLKDEEDMKNKDGGKIADYKDQLMELNSQISLFVENLAKELYGIDFKEWAGQISDALTEAFANGEDAAEAFKNVTNGIIKGITNKMLQTLVIQPMFDKLQKGLFGDEGILKTFSDLENKSEEVTAFLSNFFKGEGQNMIDASNKFLEALDDASGGAITSSGDSSDKGLSASGIQASEDTMNLTNSYLNAIRADVSLKRTLMERLVNDLIPRMSVTADAQLSQLRIIADNTTRQVKISQSISDLLYRNTDKGTNKFRI